MRTHKLTHAHCHRNFVVPHQTPWKYGTIFSFYGQYRHPFFSRPMDNSRSLAICLTTLTSYKNLRVRLGKKGLRWQFFFWISHGPTRVNEKRDVVQELHQMLQHRFSQTAKAKENEIVKCPMTEWERDFVLQTNRVAARLPLIASGWYN